MAQRSPFTIITRRSIASATAMLAMSAASASVAEPVTVGTDLLEAAAQTLRLNRHTIAVKETCRSEEAQYIAEETLRPAYDKLTQALDTVITTPARTVEEMRAKAAVIADFLTFPIEDSPEHDLDQRLIGSLLRDLTGEPWS